MGYQRKTDDIFTTSELNNVLKNISDKSLVAKILLKKRIHKDYLEDNPINYLDISKTDNTKISYLNKNKMDSLDINEYWDHDKRYHAKPGKVLQKIFKELSPREIENFSNLYKSEILYKDNFEFKIVSGYDIKLYYIVSSYASIEGSLGSSCMKYDECQEYLNLYCENSDKISMIVMLDSMGRTMGRAILWDLENYKIMDRVYLIDDEKLLHYFKQWATENGYLYKSEQNWYNSLWFENLKTKKQLLKIDVSLSNFNSEYYPYLDTFKFMDSNKILHNYQPENIEFSTLISTGGRMEPSDVMDIDELNNVYYSSDSIVRVYHNGANVRVIENNTVFSHLNSCYILISDARYDENVGSYVYIDESLNEKNILEKNTSEANSGNTTSPSQEYISLETVMNTRNLYGGGVNYTISDGDGNVNVNE